MIGPIDYAITGGFSGGGDGTSLHVEQDGTLTRRNHSGPTETGRVDRMTIDALDARIEAAEFPALEARYGSDAADDFLHRITVQIDGDTHTVEAATEASYPERLKAVVDALQDLLTRPL